MKKIASLILLIMVIALNGCSLAQTDVTTEAIGLGFYIPVKVDFEVKTGFGEEVLPGEFYWSWLCDIENPDFHCTNYKYGDGFFINDQNMHTDVVTDTNGYTTITHLYQADLTIYFSPDIDGYIVYPIIQLYDLSNSQIIEESLYGYALQSNVTVTRTGTYSLSEDDTSQTSVTVEYTLHFQEIDELQSITVMEFDDQNELIQSTVITKDNLLNQIDLAASTAYVILEEEYMNSDLETYRIRSLYNPEKYTQNVYVSMKFLGDSGFATQEALQLIFPS